MIHALSTVADTPLPLDASAPAALEIELNEAQLTEHVQEARSFFEELRRTHAMTPGKGLTSNITPDWAPKLIRRHGIAGAVIEKAGSRAYVKRRPDDASGFLAYVESRHAAKAPLLFRVGFGPIKNANHCGPLLEPDWAEYLTLAQLMRMLGGISSLYPHGLRAEIVPDDLRSCTSNLCPASRAQRYIGGLQRMVADMGLADVITVENGQNRLYKRYNVPAYYDAANAALECWRQDDPQGFATRFAAAVENAGKNIYCAREKTADEIETSAWRYLAAHRAEVLSGLWSPGDAFPLRYGNHPNSYQIYTYGFKKTKLPWQIALPLHLLDAQAA